MFLRFFTIFIVLMVAACALSSSSKSEPQKRSHITVPDVVAEPPRAPEPSYLHETCVRQKFPPLKGGQA
jgi:hypothetical protein